MKSIMQIALCGLRGGSGTTSVTAMLADSLRQMNESVLVVDLNPDDLLRLHFNIPYGDHNGWAYGELSGRGWTEQTYQVDDHLWVLPYGRHGVASLDGGEVCAQDVWTSEFKKTLSAMTKQEFSWVLFDAPCDQRQYGDLHKSNDLHLLVSQPDIAAHILLGQRSLSDKTRILINGLKPGSRLNEAIVLDWSIRYARELVPIRLHEDSHIQDALGHKMPASSYFPESAAARSMLSVAMWCMTLKGQRL